MVRDNDSLREVEVLNKAFDEVSKTLSCRLTDALGVPLGVATETTLALIKAQTDKMAFSAAGLQVDTEITVSGDVIVEKLKISDGAGNPLTSKDEGSSIRSLDVNIRSSVIGTPKHYNGLADIAPAAINFAVTTKHFQIENMSIAAKWLKVSFDAGVTFRTMNQGEVLDLDCSINSVIVKSQVDALAYEILTVE